MGGTDEGEGAGHRREGAGPAVVGRGMLGEGAWFHTSLPPEYFNFVPLTPLNRKLLSTLDSIFKMSTNRRQELRLLVLENYIRN